MAIIAPTGLYNVTLQYCELWKQNVSDLPSFLPDSEKVTIGVSQDDSWNQNQFQCTVINQYVCENPP